MRFNPRQLAWAAILFETAHSDAVVKPVEIDTICRILGARFNLDRTAARALCERHSRDVRRAGSKPVLAKAFRILSSEEIDHIYQAMRAVILADEVVMPQEEIFLSTATQALDAKD